MSEAAIVDDLSKIGIHVDSLGDLIGRPEYRAAAPVLIKWLDLETDSSTLDSLVRALSVPWARPAASEPLVRLFPRVQDDTGLGLRWVVGNGIAETIARGQFQEVRDLAFDLRYGRAREMLPRALRRSRHPDWRSCLVELLRDPDIAGHALAEIDHLRSVDEAEAVRGLVDDPRAWVRRRARRLLASSTAVLASPTDDSS